MEIRDDKRKQVGNDFMSLGLNLVAASVDGVLSAVVHLDGDDSACSLTYSGACHKPLSPLNVLPDCQTVRLPCSMESINIPTFTATLPPHPNINGRTHSTYP